MSKLSVFSDRFVRIFLKNGEVFEGEVEFSPRDYNLLEYGRHEDALLLEDRVFFEREAVVLGFVAINNANIIAVMNCNVAHYAGAERCDFLFAFAARRKGCHRVAIIGHEQNIVFTDGDIATNHN